jgi:hypothetical protein
MLFFNVFRLWPFFALFLLENSSKNRPQISPAVRFRNREIGTLELCSRIFDQGGTQKSNANSSHDLSTGQKQNIWPPWKNAALGRN